MTAEQSAAANTCNPKLSVALLDFFVNSVPAGKIVPPDDGASSSPATREASLPDLDPSEAAFIKQFAREMTYPARPLPVLLSTSGAIIKA